MSVEDAPTEPMLVIPPRIVAVPSLPSPLTYVEALSTAPRGWIKGSVRPGTQGIVIHATEGHEGHRQAINCANDFAHNGGRAAHAVVDRDQAVQCVPWEAIAFHCHHTGNQRLLGVELCGLAEQSERDWFDGDSLPMLCIAARLFADLCAAWRIPALPLDVIGLRGGQRGITTHVAVSDAWHESDHRDPGSRFPLYEFIDAVAVAMSAPKLVA